jgi:muconate cycloisomerase
MSEALESITTTIVDLPTRRPHGFANTTMGYQSLVIVEVRSGDGLAGIGEGVTPGGPWWGGESIEGIKLMIDSYLAPAVLRLNNPYPRTAMQAMDRHVADNSFAKAAVEMALWDLLGKRAGLSVAELLGGPVHATFAITWALSAEDAPKVTDEAVAKLAEGYRGFKFKMGAINAGQDIARVAAIREKLPEDIFTVADPNGVWGEYTARLGLRALATSGIDVIEQPVPGWNIDALARLRGYAPIQVLADESARTVQDAMALGRSMATDSVSLKVPKAGGIGRAEAMAKIAVASGIDLYGGSTLESSIGAAASAQLFATWPRVLACELVGPQLLKDDIVVEPIRYRDGQLEVPVGPGLGVDLDQEKVKFYARR